MPQSQRYSGRRRISPRTKHRYYTVRNFFRKALGTSSSLDNTVSVTEDSINKSCGNDGTLHTFRSDQNSRNNSPKMIKKIQIDTPNRSNDSASTTRMQCLFAADHMAPTRATWAGNTENFRSTSYSCHHKNRRRTKHANDELNNSIKNYTTTIGRCDIKRWKDFEENTLYRVSRESRHKRSHRHRSEHALRQGNPASHVVHRRFIEDIIRKQYKPIRIYGDSQLSAPLCRDYEDLQAPDFDNCFKNSYQPPVLRSSRSRHSHRIRSDMRMSSNKQDRSKHRSKERKSINESLNDPNDSSLDLVPVKETSSPKSRTKLEGANSNSERYIEVPPSPKSNRPKLNLQSQYKGDCYDLSDIEEPRSTSRETDTSRVQQNLKQMELNATRNSLCTYENEQLVKKTNIDEFHNQVRQQQDKDVELDEIKNILHGFLQEIKRKSVTEVCHKPVMTNATEINSLTGQNYAASTVPHLQAFPYAPPCYSLLPLCPMNCSHAACFPTTQNYTCPSCQCAAASQTTNQDGETIQPPKDSQENNNTEELIKEIFKLITEKKNSSQISTGLDNTTESQSVSDNKITDVERSACDNGDRFEARLITSANYSESVIENLSARATCTDGSFKVDSLIIKKKSTTGNVLKKGYVKRNGVKRERSARTEASGDQLSLPTCLGNRRDVMHKKPRILSRIINVFRLNSKKDSSNVSLDDHNSIHSQQNKPCFNNLNPNQQSKAVIQQLYHTTLPAPFFTSSHDHGQLFPCSVHNTGHQFHHKCEQTVPPPTAPPYYEAHSWNNPPQLPLCVKEVEVQSIGTQSNIKIPFFQRFVKKAKPKFCDDMWTQTDKDRCLFNWKKSPIFNRKVNFGPKKVSVGDELQAALARFISKQNAPPPPQYSWMKNFMPNRINI